MKSANLCSVVLVTVTGWYRTKCPMHYGHFLIYCASPPPSSSNHSLFIHQCSMKAAETSSTESGRWREMSNLADAESVTRQWFLICRIILRRGASGFTSPPKEDVLRIFIALKNHPRPGLNPRTLGPMASTQIITTPRMTMQYCNEITISQRLDWKYRCQKTGKYLHFVGMTHASDSFLKKHWI
jgi:hypothetical protein